MSARWRLALKDADAVAEESCATLIGLVKEAKRLLSQPTASTFDVARVLDLIAEKSRYLRDTIDGLQAVVRINDNNVARGEGSSAVGDDLLEPTALLRRLDGWLAAAHHGVDHPWRVSIAKTLEHDRAFKEGATPAAYVDADEFDEHVESLKEIRVLAEAGVAFVSYYHAEETEHTESGYLFAAVAVRARAASEALDKTVAYLVQLATQKRGGVQ